MMSDLNWDNDGSQDWLMSARSAQQCLSAREIEDFLFDRLSGVTREVIEEHLLVCAHCLELVEKEDEYVGTMRAAARSMETEQLERAYQAPAPKPWWAAFSRPAMGMALAAVAVVVMVGVYYFRPGGTLTEAEIALSLDRSVPGRMPTALAGQPLSLAVDLGSLPAGSKDWLVVSPSGETLASGAIAPGGGTTHIKLPRGLSAGAHWVRIRRADGSLLREYALTVK
jgi:hypothetical protein